MIELKITVTDRSGNLREIAERHKQFMIKRGRAETVIRSRDPSEVIEKAREAVGAVENRPGPPKGFKASRPKSNAT